MTRLVDIRVDAAGLPPADADTEQERRVAIFDLLEANSFVPLDPAGAPLPGDGFRLVLSRSEGRLWFDIADAEGQPLVRQHLSMDALRQVAKDYRQICDSYHDAVHSLPPARIETIDTARREIHTEGARLVQHRLAGRVTLDLATARRLFTLICAIQAGT
ncbi:UPF0262 family protein [Mesobaculum littorinae]|uniref:UPF0262 family protein n=1 Tax=Mesobaculum littorinae TaxID=2486419 RepID=A0A438AMK7_9RHOB|nr:UPF0262 family protein [Mesobaculum littorinae]RVV99922.1 UPF0262 family protein [Mesobaculum littorinae]